jgi:FKBP-type peptidyl-prolyl cis-trans isomerase
MINHVGYEVPEDKVFVSYIENVAEENNLDPNGTALYGPYKVQNGSVNEGFTEGVMLMKEGGQATLIFPSSLGYGSSGSGKVGAYSSLKYEIELLEVIPDIEVYEQNKINTYLDTIFSYESILDEGTGATMYYMIDRPTDGQLIENDSAVSLAYTGMLLDGRVFDSKDADDPYTFTMGEADHITGWDLGLLRLREGEKARLLIPYPLAYGEAGRIDQTSGLQAIPPYETLLFEIEVLTVGGETEDNNVLPVEQ